VPVVEGSDRFMFPTDHGTHYTPSSRVYRWNRVRCVPGLPEMTLYLATRHVFGWYALNVLKLAPHVIAAQLGHVKDRENSPLVIMRIPHPVGGM
jgi:hypothetical protein